MVEDIAGELVTRMERQLQQDRHELEQSHRRFVRELRLEVVRTASTQHKKAAASAAGPVTGELPCSNGSSLALHPTRQGMGQDGVNEQQASKVETSPSDNLDGHEGQSPRCNERKLKKRKSRILGPTAKTNANFLSKLVQSSAFEAVFGLLIVANAFVIGAEVQVQSYALAQKLGLNDDTDADHWTQYVDDTFPTLDMVFGTLFWIELFLKLLAQRATFFCSGWNLFDTGVMVAWSTEKSGLASLVVPPTLLRIFRLSRLLRLVRVFRHYEFCDPVQLMVSSIKASMWVLMWTVILLGLIMAIVALVLNNLLEDFMAQPTQALNERQEVFVYFGSFTRSMVTLFEVTLGNWVPPCRVLMEVVAEWYAFLFIAYKLLVGFAVMKCIAAIFLCETMKCASMNDEMMIQSRARAKQKFVQKMTILFQEADHSGDGVITQDEFVNIVGNERVRFWLQAMDLNIHDPIAFFAMLDTEGDGELTAEELITGMARLRGSATQIRMIMTQDLIRDEASKFRREIHDQRDRNDGDQASDPSAVTPLKFIL